MSAIKIFLVYLTAGVILSLAYLFLALVFSKSAYADELPQELIMKTDHGELVLTIKECQVVNEHGFVHAAYATWNEDTHLGCWSKDHDIVSIWFYAEPTPLIATYKDHYFVPRK